MIGNIYQATIHRNGMVTTFLNDEARPDLSGPAFTALPKLFTESMRRASRLVVDFPPRATSGEELDEREADDRFPRHGLRWDLAEHPGDP